MSHASASLVLIVMMIGLAIYFLVFPPLGFDKIGHRISIPFILLACAFMILENLRTRTHIAQLVGALRAMMQRRGDPPTPEAKREAVAILLKSLRSDSETARTTAAEQLRHLTGQKLGDSPEEWEGWWAQNKESFG